MTSNCKFALLQTLADVGGLMPEKALFAEVNIRCAHPVTWTDFRQMLAEACEKRRVLSVAGEDGVKWKITDDGLGRLAELV
jgi:hypothetical protein